MKADKKLSVETKFTMKGGRFTGRSSQASTRQAFSEPFQL